MKHLPNFITSLNLVTGAIGIVLVIEGNLTAGLYCVIVAGIFDFLDGLVARLLGVSSPIGKELDSLADIVSFGLLPAIFMMTLLEPYIEGNYRFFGLVIVIFSALRLAKFNIDPGQSDKFIGLPTPANAIMITSLILVPVNWINLVSLIIITSICSWLLISPLEMMAFKFKNYGWRGNEIKYSFVSTIIILLIIFGLQALAMVIPVYVLFSLIGNYASISRFRANPK